MASKFVTDFIRANPVALITKAHCPYSLKARQLFESEKVKFAFKDIDNEPNMNEIQDYLQQLTGARTVPRVFINGNCIGGFDATKKMHDEGKLIPEVRALDNNRMNAQKMIQDTVTKNPVVMFTKSGCSSCQQAKQLMEQEKINYLAKDIDKEQNVQEIEQALAQLTGDKTVPRVFIAGRPVGGLDAVKKMQSEGKLKEAVRAGGA